MAYWNEGGFFKSVAGHLIKWWQIVIMPVFRLNNNRNASDALDMNMTDEEATEVLADNTVKQGNPQEPIGVKQETANSQMNTAASTEDADAADILSRLEKEKREAEEKKRKEIEAMRQKAQEEERIAAIMNANKVAVDSFIAEGKANRETQEELDAKQAEEERKQEELRRAQEIIDRLNREAAEDEAKKQAEITKAQEEAKEKFG